VTDRESFLTRWSRLKREADDAAVPAAEPAPPHSDEPAPEPETRSCVNESSKEDIDSKVAALPPIESITNSTDIRAFLDPAIPAPLTRAALRRAWVADPAIRDFVGLSENAWDFNAPDGVPGFGSLLPSDQVQRMLVGMLGDAGPATASGDSRETQSGDAREALQKPEVIAPVEVTQAYKSEPVPRAVANDRAVADQNDSNVAPQEENPADDSAKTIAQRHGGALPR